MSIALFIDWLIDSFIHLSFSFYIISKINILYKIFNLLAFYIFFK